MKAIMAVDPGGTTGVAATYFNKRPTIKETLQNLPNFKTAEVSGGWEAQGEELAQMWARFRMRANVEHSIALPDIHLVCEDFVLRRREAGGATGNLTSIWVMAGFIGAAGWPEVAYQQASQAKSFATNDRLKLWDIYTVGSEHKRDATRHMALRINKLLSMSAG